MLLNLNREKRITILISSQYWMSYLAWQLITDLSTVAAW